MIRLLMIASIHIRDFMRRYMPSNILLDRIRTRRGLKWGIPAVLLAIPYFAVAHWCTTIIGNDGPGWLNLVVLVCVWSAFKMLWIGPVSLVHLLRAKASEHRARRDDIRHNHDEPCRPGSCDGSICEEDHTAPPRGSEPHRPS